MSIHVTVEDIELGESENATIKAGEYVVICAEPRYIAGEQRHANGTVVITLKRREATDAD